METNPGPENKGWHVAKWSSLAWLETGIKGLALLIGIFAGIAALAGETLAIPRGAPLVQMVVLTLLSLGLIAAIFDRLAEREVVAMFFVILNNLGHWGMTLALASLPGPGVLLIFFAGLMLLGDLVKLVFLKTSGFSVRNASRGLLYGLTLFYVVGYALILVLSLVN